MELLQFNLRIASYTKYHIAGEFSVFQSLEADLKLCSEQDFSNGYVSTYYYLHLFVFPQTWMQ